MMANYEIIHCSNAAADLEGGATGAPPPQKKKLIDYVFFPPYCIRMLKNKAQIARESIKNQELLSSRALKRAMDPCRKGIRSSRS